MKYSWMDVPKKKEVWACAYSTNNTEKSMALRKTPVRGIVDGGLFYEIGKTGKIKKSGSVSAYARSYADTEEECIEIYNSKVNNQITFLEKLIEECKSNLI
ncbi:hypothetical protein [Romboutsia sp.]|uniref:hypothetical protein n=1 Tax=Romboutsia sp. TaxID=1965302 RepID=UPI002CA225AE|nr:hypothetical protein [Romboutsia sp.]HSQ89790.1 hypothetical protein [Romboutsia sp.]